MNATTVSWPNIGLEKEGADSFIVGQDRDGNAQEIRFGAAVATNVCDWLSRFAQASEPPTVQIATAEAVSKATTPVADWPNVGLQKVGPDSFILRQDRDGKVHEVPFGLKFVTKLCNWLKRYLPAGHPPAFTLITADSHHGGL